jgi:hypothetical protein
MIEVGREGILDHYEALRGEYGVFGVFCRLF